MAALLLYICSGFVTKFVFIIDTKGWINETGEN